MKSNRILVGVGWWIAVLTFILSGAVLTASEPEWWSRRGVIDPERLPRDFAAANQGQVKHLATQAYQEMEDSLIGGAGETISSLVHGFSDAGNYYPVNLGQLKAVAAPFYTRLGLPTPWTGIPGEQNDYAMVNIGQVKNAFSFDIARALELSCPSNITVGQSQSTDPDYTGWAVASDECEGDITISYMDEVHPASEDVSIVAWNFPDGGTANSFADGGILENRIHSITTVGNSGTIGFTQSGVSTRAANASGWQNGSGTKAWQIELTTRGYSNLRISSKQRSSSTAPRDFKLQYSLDGLVWVDVAHIPQVSDNWTSGVLENQPLPEVLNDQPVIYLRWVMASNIQVTGEPRVVGSQGNSRIDDIQVVGDTLGSTISRTWSATNLCGNVAHCIQIITVIENPPPVLTCPGDVTIGCAETLDPSNTGWATATNDSGDELDISYTDAMLPATQELTVVEWVFPDGGTADELADGGTDANVGIALLTTVGGTGVIGFDQSGHSTLAVNATGWQDGMDSKAWQVEFSTAGYANLRVSSEQRSSMTGPRDFKLQYSLDGVTWTDVTAVPYVQDNWTSGVLSEQLLPEAVNNQAKV